jgi:cardiolipin synthase
MVRDGVVNYLGGHEVTLLTGGDGLFPQLIDAIAEARREVWLATYIFNDDASGHRVAQALSEAAQRGVAVHVLVDGFGSKAWLPLLQPLLSQGGVRFEVFRPLHRWWSWLQPQQLRRLHQKLCSVDGHTGFVGGINIIDDRYDMNHGWSELPRLDFAVRLRGPVALEIEQVVRSLWLRAHLGRGWRTELRGLAGSARPVRGTLRLLHQLRPAAGPGPLLLRPWRGAGGLSRHADTVSAGLAALPPVRAALVVRDNLRQRRAIERSYIQAIGRAQQQIDIACPYFYPGVRFRRALERAASRGVTVRLLLQGKVDYRFAALAARVLYDSLLGHGIRIYEYTPAFLHAKVAVVDGHWATVGSSNIDPLSLLLNLEANAVVQDAAFVQTLSRRLDEAFAVSHEVDAPPIQRGWRGLLVRGLVAWVANTYLKVAGITGRY